MSDRPAKERPPPTLSNSNDNHTHGSFNDASAVVDAARMGGGTPEAQGMEPPAGRQPDSGARCGNDGLGLGHEQQATGIPLTTRGLINRLRREGWAESAGNWLMIFTKPGFNPIIVPRHGGDIPNGTLRSICRALSWEYPPRS